MVNLHFNGFAPGITRPRSTFSRCGDGEAARKTTRQQENVAGLLIRNLTSSIESSGRKKATDVSKKSNVIANRIERLPPATTNSFTGQYIVTRRLASGVFVGIGYLHRPARTDTSYRTIPCAGQSRPTFCDAMGVRGLSKGCLLPFLLILGYAICPQAQVTTIDRDIVQDKRAFPRVTRH